MVRQQSKVLSIHLQGGVQCSSIQCCRQRRSARARVMQDGHCLRHDCNLDLHTKAGLVQQCWLSALEHDASCQHSTMRMMRCIVN
jgi:hypothetical protein